MADSRPRLEQNPSPARVFRNVPRRVSVPTLYVRVSQSRICIASVTKRLAKSSPRRENLMISQGAPLGVPPPKPNVRKSATRHRNIQPRLKGRRTLNPAATTRTLVKFTRQAKDGAVRRAPGRPPSVTTSAWASVRECPPKEWLRFGLAAGGPRGVHKCDLAAKGANSVDDRAVHQA